MRLGLPSRPHPRVSTTPGLADALPFALLAVGLAEAVVALGSERPAAVAVVPLLVLPLLWRRRHPIPVALAVTAALAVQLPSSELRLFDRTFTVFVCLAIAAYAVARHGSRPWVVPAATVCAAGAALVLGLHDVSVGSGVLAAALVLAPAAVGHTVRDRVRLRRTLEAQAVRLDEAQELTARAAALEARGRIAGEVQDIVRRSVDEMVAGAGRARALEAIGSPAAGAAIAEVEESGRRALEDMRRMLGVLRSDGPAQPSPASSIDPGLVDATGSGWRPASFGATGQVLGALLAPGLMVVASVESALTAAHGRSAAVEVAAAGLAGALMAAPAVARRRHPLGAALVAWTAAAVVAIAFEPPTVALALLAALIAFASAAHARAAAAWVGLVIGAAGVVAVNLGAGYDGWGDYLFPLVIVGLAWAAGSVVRQQSDLTAVVLQRSVELGRAREAERAAAAAAERLRIARELHDVVAHSLMVMVVQAGAARRTLESGRKGCQEALAVVQETGLRSLTELHRLLDLVDPSGRPLEGSPGLDRLDELVERTRGSGLVVELSVERGTAGVPGGIDLAGYRIVQEAVTNVLRHAEATHAWIGVQCSVDTLVLDVRDNGTRAAAKPPGNGIAGMRERARIYSGEVTAGPQPEGGFRVHATIPLAPVAVGQPA